MIKLGCGKNFGENYTEEFLECGSCGNHVCKEQAKRGGGLCPHCFGKLYFAN